MTGLGKLQAWQHQQSAHSSRTGIALRHDIHASYALQGLELAVPGTYLAGEPVVTIAAFAPQLHVITSKQRPRKLTIHGSDGAEYMFLLKARTLSSFAGC